MSQNLPLPYGWIQQLDPNTGQPFWVDSKAQPPRAIWTHPYRDPQYLSEHPEVKEKMDIANKASGAIPEDPAPAYTADPSNTKDNSISWAGDFKNTANSDSKSIMPEQDATGGGNSAVSDPMSNPEFYPSTANNSKGKKKMGFFSKAKDIALGTKEERDAAKRQQKLKEEQQRAAYFKAQSQPGASGSSSSGHPGAGYGPTQSAQSYAPQQYPNAPVYYTQAVGPAAQVPQQGYPQQQAPPPQGYPQQGFPPQGPGYNGPPGYGPAPQQGYGGAPQQGYGPVPQQGYYPQQGYPQQGAPIVYAAPAKQSAGSSALPIVAGVFGGLLLGDMLF